MIVVDSSCVLAILQNEPEKDGFEAALAGGDRCVMSAVNVHEVLCVMRGRHGQAGAARIWELLAAVEIEIVPFDELQVRAAAAFDRYGRGINSKSALNLADCAAYALAKTMNSPLLFKGDDFANTDIARVQRQSCGFYGRSARRAQ
jgi:ribonuclease VapC